MNPFVQLAKKYPQDAKQIALAFTVSHDGMDEVYAVMRYAVRVGKLREGDFLMGPVFKPWHTQSTVTTLTSAVGTSKSLEISHTISLAPPTNN